MQEKLKYWQEEFQWKVNKTVGNQRLHFTTEIRTTEENSPTPTEEERVQIVTNENLPFHDMKMSWSPEGDLQFSVFLGKMKAIEVRWKGEYPHTQYHARDPFRSPELPC